MIFETTVETHPRSLEWVYDEVNVVVEVAFSKFAAYSWMGCVEAVIATWVTRIGSDHPTFIVQATAGHSCCIGF